jgi:hypothetical protein
MNGNPSAPVHTVKPHSLNIHATDGDAVKVLAWQRPEADAFADLSSNQ